MTRNDANRKETELKDLLKNQYPDISPHIDVIDGTEEIAISFFWNRLSAESWNDAQIFRGKSGDYEKILLTEVVPFFQKK